MADSQLVSYSASSSSDEDSPLKKKQKENESILPLPESIKAMFNDEGGHVDRREDHEGRVREFAHVSGIWPTHVYITVTFHDDFHTLLTGFHKELTLCLSPTEDWPLIHSYGSHDLHLSLSRTVSLLYHWITPITSSLQEQIENYKRFTISFDDLVFYTNDNKTRTFIGLHVHHGHDKLNSLVDDINQVFKQFNLPPFYEERSFHISLFWCLGNIVPKLSNKMTSNLKACWAENLSKYESLDSLTLQVSSVDCKVGNKQFNYELK